MKIPIISATKTLDNNSGIKTNIIFDGTSLQLKLLNILNDGTKIYEKNGIIEFPTVDLEQFVLKINTINVVSDIPIDSSIKIYTSTSSDGVNFEPYVILNSDNTITSTQRRYIKIKIEFEGKQELKNILINDFIESESVQFNLDDQVIFDNSLHLRTEYESGFTKESSTSNKIYISKIKKSSFEKIDSITIKE